MFLIDCGRMMTNEAAGLSLLDHALNAMLMLSFVALRQGDAVGLVCFSDQIHAHVPPRGGMAQMNRLLHAAFDRFPQLVESRYDEAFLYLDSRCKKRSLVILITNVIDEVNAQPGRSSTWECSSAAICRWACCSATIACSTRPRLRIAASSSCFAPPPPPRSSPGGIKC